MAKRSPPVRVVQPQDAPEPLARDEKREGLDTGAAFHQLLASLKRDATSLLRWIVPHLRQATTTVLAMASAWVQWAGRRGRTVFARRAQDASPTEVTADAATATAKSRRVRATVLTIVACLSALIVLTVGVLVWALNDVPFDSIASGNTTSQIIALTDSTGEPIIQRGPYQQVAARSDQFPQHLVQAVLAIEDRRFYDHWGIDVWGVIRALRRNIFAGEVREGGSTITQQLLKVLYLDSDRTVRRKLQELFLSVWLESRLSKDEILALYLNNVYLGAGATGMPAAAQVYFNKSVAELTLAESAMLAGLIASPSALNPIENLSGARDRAATVLKAMQDAGYLDEQASLEAQLNSAQLKPTRASQATGSWFVDWAMQEAQQAAGQFIGSVQVKTTLVPDLQFIAEQSVASVMGDSGAAAAGTQAAMVVLGPDGAVLAMVGGLDYGESEFNRALAMRQPGSTFKLFTYYAAIKMGAEPGTRLLDRPLDVDGWEPQNFDGEFSGRVTLAEAFAKSLNVPTVQLGMEVGLPNIIAAARELGIDAPLQETPSLILGASEVSLLDMTGAYASVRAGQAPIQPYGIATFQAPNGRPFAVGSQASPSVSLAQTHETMLGLLQLAVERGTGQAAKLPRFAAGKTGTTQDYRDAWFIGFDANYTVGVWVGNDDGTPMDEVTGGQLPAQIWHAFMTDAVPPDSEGMVLPVGASTDAPAQCNIQACSQSYRSFRASDCTFQPYSGPRRICEK